MDFSLIDNGGNITLLYTYVCLPLSITCMRLSLFLALLLPFSFTSYCKQLDVVVGWDKPPYVISEQHSGFEVELVRAIFADIGYEITPIYVPFGRTARVVNSGSVDVGLTLTHKHDIDATLLSNEYIAYQNVAVSLQERSLSISSLQDLSGKSIIAFQTAKSVLGEAFYNAVDQQPTYLELAEQKRQVSLLLLGSVDVAILDRNIFNYIKSQFPSNQQHATQIHPIFPVSTYRAAIPDALLRRQFDIALAQFIADGRYQALLDKFGLENLLFTTYQKDVATSTLPQPINFP